MQLNALKCTIQHVTKHILVLTRALYKNRNITQFTDIQINRVIFSYHPIVVSPGIEPGSKV